MSTPTAPTGFGTPGTAGGGPLPPVNFSTGGHQTFKGSCKDGLEPATCTGIEACISTFEGKQTEQYVFLFTLDSHPNDGVVAWYTSRKFGNHPKMKLPPTLTALKLPFPTPENPNMPNPVGAKARLLVKNEARRDGQGTVLKIKEVLEA